MDRRRTVRSLRVSALMVGADAGQKSGCSLTGSPLTPRVIGFGVIVHVAATDDGDDDPRRHDGDHAVGQQDQSTVDAKLKHSTTPVRSTYRQDCPVFKG